MACQFIHRGFLVFWLTFSLGVMIASGTLESSNKSESLENNLIQNEISETGYLVVEDKTEEKSVDLPNENSQTICCLINTKILHLVKPIYPREAKEAGISGKVSVQVIIDENGNVISAKVVSGHPLLSKETEAAALQTKFKPTTLSGKAVKFYGNIVYKFEAD